MGEQIYSAIASGIIQERRLEFLANNLANSSTIGYKQDRPIFDIAYFPNASNVKQDKNTGNVSLTSDNFLATLAGTKIDYTPGALAYTGNNLDLTIEGEGFFVIETPQGRRYTRQGTFGLSPQGILTNEQGYQVAGERGEITITGSRVLIKDDGTVMVDGREIDKILIHDFPKPYMMVKEGGALFVAPQGQNGTPTEQGAFKVKQGYLEMANVNVIREMTLMMEVLRAYESYQKVIQTITEANSRAINQVGKTV